MDENGARIIIAIVGLLATIVGSYTSYRLTADKATERIEALSREAAGNEVALDVAQKDLLDLRPRLTDLQTSFTELQERYALCTSSRGIVISPASTSQDSAINTIRTGDRLQFKLSSSSAFIEVARVTNDGPVVRVTGCTNPGVLAGTRSPRDGDNAFLLTLGSTLSLSLSTECCDRGLAYCSLHGLEQVDLLLIDFDTAKQVATLRYQKTGI